MVLSFGANYHPGNVSRHCQSEMSSVQTDFNLVTFDYIGLLYVCTSSEIKCPMNSIKDNCSTAVWK